MVHASPTDRRWTLVIGLLACCAGAFVFWPVLTNPGYWNHDELELLHALHAGATPATWRFFAETSGPFYRPLGFVALLLQLDVAGDSPRWCHAISVAHHLANVGLAALVIRACGGRAAAAAWLLVLPSVVGGVAWVAAAYDRLELTLLLLAVLLLRARGRACAVAAVVVFATALVTKESAVCFGAAAWLFVRDRGRPARLAAAAITALAVAFGLWRLLHATELPASHPYSAHGVDAAAWTVRLARYVVFPFAIGAEEPAHVWGVHWLAGAALLVPVATAALLRRPASTLAAAAIVVLTLLPVLPVRFVSSHYTYIGSPAWAWLLWAATAAPAVTVVPAAAPRRRMAVFRAALLALGAALALHARQAAEYHRLAGTAMRALERAHAALPDDAVPVRIGCADALMHAVALRFAVYVRLCNLAPPVVAMEPGEPWDLELAANGSVVERP